jgi:hypothetical protein
VNRSRAWFEGMAANPPLWMRLLYVPAFGLAALFIGERRGWVVGVIAAIVYGGIGLAGALAPGGLMRWSRAHPVLDNAFLGPFLFLALAYLTHVSVWWCAIAGVLGGIGGIALGTARRRTLASRD